MQDPPPGAPAHENGLQVVLALRPRKAVWTLSAFAIVLSLLSVLDDLLLPYAGSLRWSLGPLLRSEDTLSLSRWYSTFLFVLASLAATSVAQQASRSVLPGAGKKRAWLAIAAAFLVLSAAKVTALKGAVMALSRAAVRAAGMDIRRSVAAVLVLLVLGLAFLPFLVSVERRTRRRLFVAAAVYLGGVVVLDLASGLVGWVAGRRTEWYAAMSSTEELVEMAGVILFIRALLCHLDWLGQERNVP